MKLKEDSQISNLFNHFIDLKEIDDGSIIIDAGTRRGDFIQCLRKHKRGENCRIIAIECSKDNVTELKERNYQNVTICDKALVGQNNFDDKVMFTQIVKNTGWGNLFGRTYKGRKRIRGIKEYEVETLKINDIFSVLGIEWIDFLKMDIEGAEGDILKTMTKETAAKIDQVSMEVHEWCGLSIPDAIEKLNGLGFKAFKPIEIEREIYGKRLDIKK